MEELLQFYILIFQYMDKIVLWYSKGNFVIYIKYILFYIDIQNFLQKFDLRASKYL